MPLIYPAYVIGAFQALRTFRDFVGQTRFSPAEGLPPYLVPKRRDDILALYRERGDRTGLFTAMRETIRAVHTSPAFGQHLKSDRITPDAPRLPRLNRLLPREEAADRRREDIVVAFLKNAILEDGALADDFNALIELFFVSPLFAEAGWKDGRPEAAAMLFDMQPILAFRLLGMTSGIDPVFALCLRYGAVRYFMLNRYFEKAIALCQAYFEEFGDSHMLGPEFLDQLWYASFRMGDLATAESALDRWIGQKVLQKRPVVYKALVTAMTDREKALGLLHAVGAGLGECTPGGNLLYAEYAMRLGRLDDAERAIRRALATATDDTAPTFLFCLHNILLMRGIQSRALVPVFARSGLKLQWERFGIDTIVDRTEDLAVPAGAKVSIVMTAYNAEDYLHRAATSILDQSYRNLELIIIDDRSDDGTAAVCQALTADPRVRILHNAVNLGTYASKNIGIAAAQGDYIALCDSDDVWLRTHLAEHLLVMEADPTLVASTSQWVRVREDGSVECGLRGGYVEACPHSTFFRRSVFETVGYFDSVRFGADREFVNRIQLHFGGVAIRAIRKILTLGRRHDRSLTTSGAGALSEFNESPIRMAYWKNWNEWQIAALAEGRLPFMPARPDPRPFPVPPEMAVDS